MPRATRILHCIPTMGGGGAERQLTYLARDLVPLGWDVHVAFVRDGPNSERLARSRSTLHRLSASRNYSPALFTQLRRLIAEVQPDLVQTWIRQMDIFAGAAASLAGVPWILSERNESAAYPRCLPNRLREWVGRRATAVISNSTGGDRYWQPLMPARAHRWVIASGFPLVEIEAAPPADPERRGVLYAARFSAEKNPESFVEALARATVRVPSLHATLCGEGPLRSKIEGMLARSGLTAHARFAGYVEPAWGLMKAAQVFVSLSFFEGHPNTVSEAMFCGCPLILSDIRAHRDLIGDDGALFVDPRRPADIADAVVRVLTQPEEAAARAVVARRRAEQWTIPEMVRRYDAAYRELLHLPSAVRVSA